MEPVNLKKIAKELNLAISTVSRALSDNYAISDKTKKKVLAMAAQLNYQPNPYAGSLRKHQSRTIAVVIPEVANNFFSLAINGIESIAQEKNYHVLIYLTHEDYQKEISICGHLQNGRVDGVLMSVSSETANIDHLLELRSKGIPMVFFDRICEGLDTPKITTDDCESGFKATEHLIANGCESIAFLSISRKLSISKKRKQGYLDALNKYNLKEQKDFIVYCNNDSKIIYRQVRSLLTKTHRPDAIFASVEKLAIIAYHVCEDLKLNIPRDIKIISFSNLETASLLNPSLTTITQPAFDIGKNAAMALFKRLEKKRSHLVNENIVVKSVLIPRNSTLKG